MTKRRWSLVLVVAGVIVASGFGIAHHWLQDPPLGYYLHWTHRKCLLPEQYIRPAFRHMTERDMPQVADNAQAIWFGSREPHIFVRFETDANGIAHIERAFNIPGAKCKVFDAERVRGLVQSGVTFFPYVVLWQERTGTAIFDPNSLGPGRKITYSRSGWEGWEVYIDQEQHTVYVYAWPYT